MVYTHILKRGGNAVQSPLDHNRQGTIDGRRPVKVQASLMNSQ